jgi:hypothetical protein
MDGYIFSAGGPPPAPAFFKHLLAAGLALVRVPMQ